LLRALDIPSGPLETRLVVSDAARGEARQLLTDRGWNGTRPLVAIAPGAAYGTAKRWPPGHFARLASRLVNDEGALCVFVGGAADAYTVRAVCDLLQLSDAPHTIDLCGRTTLSALAGVLALSRACVSNDSGAMHVAAAVGVPLAALFGPTNEQETAPLSYAGTPTHVLTHHVPCRPCMLRECPIEHPCMQELDPSRVLSVVTPMLTASNLEPRTTNHQPPTTSPSRGSTP
jgi:heptosyltransferase-2